MLNGPAIDAWKDGGSQRRAWNSRLVSAVLVVGGNRKECLHVLLCYAPTFAAIREMKDDFYNVLQQALSSIPQRENLSYWVISVHALGLDQLNGRGPHGYGELNDAGRELLIFLSVNEATVCNTWFEMKAIHKRTWQHLHQLCNSLTVPSQKMPGCRYCAGSRV